jgi:hypothetical protein
MATGQSRRNAATIATTIERMRERCLPGREAVEVGDVWSVLTRSSIPFRSERRDVRDHAIVADGKTG